MTTTIDQLVRMGLHFGHHTSKWNPKMAPYIYTKRNGTHIIDVIQTYSYLKQVATFLTKSAAQGKTFLFVGTKRQSAPLISRFALESGSFYVNQRWLGGMLTNWSTMRVSIATLSRLEVQERSGLLDRLPKRERALIKRERERLERYLGGVKGMSARPDVVVIVGQQEEMNAVQECRKLAIRNVTLLDTDCDPTLADLFVPVNDDSISSLKFVLGSLSQAIRKGQEGRDRQKLQGKGVGERVKVQHPGWEKQAKGAEAEQRRGERQVKPARSQLQSQIPKGGRGEGLQQKRGEGGVKVAGKVLPPEQTTP